MTSRTQSKDKAYLRDLEERAQRLLEMASVASSSEEDSINRRSYENSRIRHNNAQQTMGSHTVSRRKLMSYMGTFPSVDESAQKTFPERNMMQRLLQQNERISELEAEAHQTRREKEQLLQEIKTLKRQRSTQPTEPSVNFVVGELQKFKQVQRQRLQHKFEREIQHWARKVKQTEYKWKLQVNRLQKQLDNAHIQTKEVQEKYFRQKKKHQKLMKFAAKELPRINEQLKRGLDLVDSEIVRITNPHLLLQ